MGETYLKSATVCCPNKVSISDLINFKLVGPFTLEETFISLFNMKILKGFAKKINYIYIKWHTNKYNNTLFFFSATPFDLSLGQKYVYIFFLWIFDIANLNLFSMLKKSILFINHNHGTYVHERTRNYIFFTSIYVSYYINIYITISMHAFVLYNFYFLKEKKNWSVICLFLLK